MAWSELGQMPHAILTNGQFNSTALRGGVSQNSRKQLIQTLDAFNQQNQASGSKASVAKTTKGGQSRFASSSAMTSFGDEVRQQQHLAVSSQQNDSRNKALPGHQRAYTVLEGT